MYHGYVNRGSQPDPTEEEGYVTQGEVPETSGKTGYLESTLVGLESQTKISSTKTFAFSGRRVRESKVL